MIALYLIVHVAVQSVCPQNFPPSSFEVKRIGPIHAVYQAVANNCTCKQDLSVSFTMSKEKAEAALATGRVWRVGLLRYSPTAVTELKRESKTTFSVTETPEEIEP